MKFACLLGVVLLVILVQASSAKTVLEEKNGIQDEENDILEENKNSMLGEEKAPHKLNREKRRIMFRVLIDCNMRCMAAGKEGGFCYTGKYGNTRGCPRGKICHCYTDPI